MAKHNIPFGAKTTGPTKGLMAYSTVETGYDIIIPENENKLNLTEEQLSKSFWINPSITPSQMFSKNLVNKFTERIGRNPTEGHDLSSICGRKPESKWLKQCKDIYDGIADKETIAKTLFMYKDKAGISKYNTYGERILAGESIHTHDIWPIAKDILWGVIRKSFQPRVSGIYGVMMPKPLLRYYGISGTKKEGWFTRWPWTLPIYDKVEIWKDCIFADPDLISIYGGDYDGDQCAVYDKRSINGILIWKKDKEWIKKQMILPEKVESTEDKTVEEIIAIQLDQYSGCGRVFNAAKIAVDAARYEGRNIREIYAMDMNLGSKFVQPYIDGIKYKHCDQSYNAYHFGEMYTVDKKSIDHSKTFFNGIRNRRGNIDGLIDLAQHANRDSKSYYEQAVYVIKRMGWKKIEPLRPQVIIK